LVRRPASWGAGSGAGSATGAAMAVKAKEAVRRAWLKCMLKSMFGLMGPKVFGRRGEEELVGMSLDEVLLRIEDVLEVKASYIDKRSHLFAPTLSIFLRVLESSRHIKTM
jgi:hypothetical protein